MYMLNKENLRDVTEQCLGDSEYKLHALHALRFMADNIHVALGIGEPYTTDSEVGVTPGLFQKLKGESGAYYLGFVDLREGLTAIAKGFAGELYEDSREFILDSTGEFINRINGEYVIEAAKSNILLDMEPQLFLEDDEAAATIHPVSVLHVPISIGDSGAEMLFINV